MKKFILLICSIILLSGCGGVKLKNGENAVVTFKDEMSISSDEYYKALKDAYGVEKLVDIMDTLLLSKEYTETTTEEAKYINDRVLSAKQSAESMDATLEAYLSYYYGVSSEAEFKKYSSLNYRRNIYSEEYAKEAVTEKQINDYYKNHAVGDIEVSRILITSEATDSMTETEKKEKETEALNKAKDIIKKLKSGEKFDNLAKEYSKDESSASEGGYIGFINRIDNYDESFFNAAVKLEKGKYSTTPVKTDEGYYIIYKTDEKEKPSLEDAKEDIITIIASELLEQNTFLLESMKNLRKKYEIKFIDSELESAYETLMVRLENQAKSS